MWGRNPPNNQTPVYKSFGGFIVPVCYQPSYRIRLQYLSTLPAIRVFFMTKIIDGSGQATVSIEGQDRNSQDNHNRTTVTSGT
jgi:hypothetical protein